MGSTSGTPRVEVSKRVDGGGGSSTVESVPESRTRLGRVGPPRCRAGRGVGL